MSVSRARVHSIDVDALLKHFDAGAAEARWGAEWERSGVYRWDASRPRDETFVVDTPPPTVSGSLHIGHVLSYTHTDVLVRQQRMLGRNKKMIRFAPLEDGALVFSNGAPRAPSADSSAWQAPDREPTPVRPSSVA